MLTKNITVLIYIAVVNLIAFIVTAYDKMQAKRGGWRVSEPTLFFLSLIGGSVGVYLAMIKYRHKTKKLRFKLGVPTIIVIQCIVLLKFILTI